MKRRVMLCLTLILLALLTVYPLRKLQTHLLAVRHPLRLWNRLLSVFLVLHLNCLHRPDTFAEVSKFSFQLPDIDEAWQSKQILDALYKAATEQGYSLTLSNTHREQGEAARVIRANITCARSGTSKAKPSLQFRLGTISCIEDRTSFSTAPHD